MSIKLKKKLTYTYEIRRDTSGIMTPAILEFSQNSNFVHQVVFEKLTFQSVYPLQSMYALVATLSIQLLRVL